MPYHEVTIDIDASPERVWQVLSDVARWPGWTESAHEIAVTSHGPFGVASTARVRLAGAPRSVWTVTEWEPNRMFTWESNARGVHSVASHIIEPRDGGSRVTLWVRTTGLAATLFSPLISRVARRNLKWEAEGLKRRSEAVQPSPTE